MSVVLVAIFVVLLPIFVVLDAMFEVLVSILVLFEAIFPVLLNTSASTPLILVFTFV